MDDVQLIELVRHVDDRGYLYEIIHATDEFLHKFGQVYLVCSPVRGTIRAFHKHSVLWDYFCVPRGTAKFVLARASEEDIQRAVDRGESCKADSMRTYVLSERKPSLLVVPAGIWHGWMALEDETMVVATGSEVYNRDNPDEVRIPPKVFGDVWAVEER